MLLSTPGLVLHTTPYGETSVVAKVFTRQLGVQSYLVKGVRSRSGRAKQSFFSPLTSLDMVVYDSRRGELSYIKELSPRHPDHAADALANAHRFFMAEVLYRSLREDEPLPDLWDYVEHTEADNLGVLGETLNHDASTPSSVDLPICFLLTVAHHLGIEPLDNHTPHNPYFDLQEGRFVDSPTETTLTRDHSALLHDYLVASISTFHSPLSTLSSRRAIIDALIAYYQLHLSSFRHFRSHEILHTILR